MKRWPGEPPWWLMSIYRIGWDRYPLRGILERRLLHWSDLLAPDSKRVLYLWRLVVVVGWDPALV